MAAASWTAIPNGWHLPVLSRPVFENWLHAGGGWWRRRYGRWEQRLCGDCFEPLPRSE